MSQVRNFRAEELTLLSLNLQTMLLQFSEHHLKALQVSADVLAKDNDVIKVDNQDLQQFIPENGLHNPLERRRGSSQSEWHPVVFEQSKRGGESCLVSVSRGNFYLVVSRGQINGREVLSTSQDIKALIYPR